MATWIDSDGIPVKKNWIDNDVVRMLDKLTQAVEELRYANLDQYQKAQVARIIASELVEEFKVRPEFAVRVDRKVMAYVERTTI